VTNGKKRTLNRSFLPPQRREGGMDSVVPAQQTVIGGKDLFKKERGTRKKKELRHELKKRLLSTTEHGGVPPI